MFQLIALLFLNIRLSLVKKNLYADTMFDFNPSLSSDDGEPVLFALIGPTWISELNIENQGCKDVDSATIRIYTRTRNGYKEVNKNDRFSENCNDGQIRFTNLGNFQHFAVLLNRKSASNRNIVWRDNITVFTTTFPLKVVTEKLLEADSRSNNATLDVSDKYISEIILISNGAIQIPPITFVTRTSSGTDQIENTMMMVKNGSYKQSYTFSDDYKTNRIIFMGVGNLHQSVMLKQQDHKRYNSLKGCKISQSTSTCVTENNRVDGMNFIPYRNTNEEITIIFKYESESKMKTVVMVLKPYTETRNHNYLVPLIFKAADVQVQSSSPGYLALYYLK